jgi:CPA2 family monovalent cation:H+ antiporter-2
LKIQRLVVEADPTRLNKLRELGIPVLYGDASSSDILEHAGLTRARALVITLPDDASALAVVATAKKEAPELRIVARASTWDGARRLRSAGANEIVRPELEGGVEIVRRTLIDLDLPVREVQRYTDLVRREGLDEGERPSPERTRVLEDLLSAARHVEIAWLDVAGSSALAGTTLAQSELRDRAGVTVVAISRDGTFITNPTADQQIAAGDRLAVIGTPAQISAATSLVEA